MKTSAILATLAAATLVAAATPAAADWIDERQANQMQRIEHGLRNGQLTRAEYYRLVEQQREIARLERLLERDGHLSYTDRAYLSQLQAQASASIFWEKHDGQTQYDRDYGRGNGWGNGWGRGWGNGWGNGWGRGYRDHRGYGHGREHSDRNTWHRRWWAWN